jgi:outer membrane receptor protein involved in Fe transport
VDFLLALPQEPCETARMGTTGQRWARAVLVGAVILLGLQERASAAEPPLVGQPVTRVLERLRASGLEFIYSSGLLTDAERVLKEPRSRDPLTIAREILSEHHLTLSTVRPGLYAIVEQRAPREPDRSVAVEAEPAILSEVTVAASRYAVGGSLSMGSLLLEGSNLASQPALGDDSIRALSRLPGMSQNGYSAQSSVRGGEPGEVLVLLDGFPLRQAFHMPGYHSFFSVLDPQLIDQAEVYTGGFPVRYGNRLSGVFDLSTIDVEQEPRGLLGVSFFNATAHHSGGIESLDGRWLAAARVGTLKPLLNMVAPDAGDPSYSDVYARAELASAEQLRVTANVLWARDELGISAPERGERAQIESRSRYLWLRAEKEWGDRLAGSVWVGHSRIDSTRHGSVAMPAIASGSVADSRASEFWDVRSLLRWQPASRHWLEGGAEWTGENADYRYTSVVAYSPAIAQAFGLDPTLARSSVLAPARDRFSFFAAHRWLVTDELASEVGLRAQRILTRGFDREWIYDPRISLRWALAPRTALRLHWGRFHQADEIQELKVEDGLLTFPRAQRADQLIAGVEHELDNGIALRAEAFIKHQSSPRPRFENVLNPLSLLPELAPDRVMIAPSFSESRGVELSIAHASGRWSRWMSVTWANAHDEIDGRDVARSWDQVWSVTAGLQWAYGPWQLDAIANVHQGWPSTPLVIDADGNLHLDARNSSRLPTYASVDVRAQYKRRLGDGSLAVALEVTNALNRRNACCSELGVQEVEGATWITTEQASWLPPVPSLSVLWEF